MRITSSFNLSLAATLLLLERANSASISVSDMAQYEFPLNPSGSSDAASGVPITNRDRRDLRLDYNWGSLRLYPETFYMGIVYAIQDIAVRNPTKIANDHERWDPAGLLVTCFEYEDKSRATRNSDLVIALQMLSHAARRDHSFSEVTFDVFLADHLLGTGFLRMTSDSKQKLQGGGMNATASNQGSDLKHQSHATPLSIQNLPTRVPDTQVFANDTTLSALEEHGIAYSYRLLYPRVFVSTSSVFLLLVDAIAFQAPEPKLNRMSPFKWVPRWLGLRLRLDTASQSTAYRSVLRYALIGAYWYTARSLYFLDKYTEIEIQILEGGLTTGYMDIMKVHDDQAVAVQ